MDPIKSDVLVIGTGGAGLRAAIAAHERGAEVVVVCKATAGFNNATVHAGGGFRAAMEGLSPEEHLADTVRVGFKVNDPEMVQVFAEEGGERLLELKRFGVEMRVHRGGISVGKSPYPRGMGMTKPMVDHIKNLGIPIKENIIISKLLTRDERVIGAVGYDVRNDQPVTFSSKATVLATGGAGALYKRTDCPLRTTGDGYSLAYHIGATLRDMEFVQFFPLALAEPGHPPRLVGAGIVEDGHIVNKHGEDIPEKYGITERPLVLKSRGPLSVAMMREILGGNGVDGAVLLDATEVYRMRGHEDRFKTGHLAYYKEKLDAETQPIKIAPISHFFMGGIITDIQGDTGIPGLYAAGEVVGGVHGANRHGGNALTAITVFGARAGDAAAEYSKSTRQEFDAVQAETELERYRNLRSMDGNVKPRDLIDELRELMWVKASMVRTHEGLNDALENVHKLRNKMDKLRVDKPRDILEALEVPMTLDVAEMIIRSALERTESRGAHFRVDYPELDENWVKTVVLHREKGYMTVGTCSLGNTGE